MFSVRARKTIPLSSPFSKSGREGDLRHLGAICVFAQGTICSDLAFIPKFQMYLISLRLFEEFPQLVHHYRLRFKKAVDDLFNFLPRDRIKFHVSLFGFRDKLRIH